MLGAYLPAEIDAAALDAIVAEEVAAVTATGAGGGKAMGQVVKAVRTRVGDGADGARVASHGEGRPRSLSRPSPPPRPVVLHLLHQ